MIDLDTVGYLLLAIPVLLLGYAYLGYPAVLWLLTRGRDWKLPTEDPPEWPSVTIVLPVYNEEKVVGATIEALLATDYPPDRRQILVMSDASTDGTHEIVRGFVGRGVDLVVMPVRRGKTAAENESGRHATGELIINTDATTRIRPEAIKALVRAFQDPTVGCASGRDVSAGHGAAAANLAEGRYVGYEMWVRDLETRAGGIVGASGCFMGVRTDLFNQLFPEALSRDFATPLLARRAGYRSVSVKDAQAVVPRAPGLRVEFRRKSRTMARGLETLWFLKPLLNPFRYGRFALMLMSHKLVRWLGLLLMPLFGVGLALLAGDHPWALAGVVALIAGVAVGGMAFIWPAGKPPKPVLILGFVVSAPVAALVAWWNALTGEQNPIWEPTRR